MKNILIGPDQVLTPEKVVSVANGESTVVLTRKSKKAIKDSRKIVEDALKEKKIIYGITTGFGKFKDVFIDQNQVAELQANLIRSHSVGVGPYMSIEEARASFFVRINSIAQGYSGVRLEFLEFAIKLLNSDIVPAVPSQGSVGASGDLAPLSHMGLVLMGEGKVFYKGKLVDTARLFKAKKIKPVTFQAKEGLAWNNGTSIMLGLSAIAVEKARLICRLADCSAALTLEGVLGTAAAYDNKIHKVRPHKWQIKSASNIRDLIKGSKLVDSVPNRVQDSYTLRCAPQVHGASRSAVEFAYDAVLTELNSVTDNPIIFSKTKEIISGGNFHGEPLAQSMDFLAIAISEIANISERRTAKLVDAATSEGLPMFLVDPKFGGLQNGLMISHYTAAALVSENKVHSHPASVDSIPTSANQEDHVSMGSISSRKVQNVIANTEMVLAIEFLTATQAIDFRDNKKLGGKTEKMFSKIRSKVATYDDDRILNLEMEAVLSIITDNSFLDGVLKKVD